MPHLRQNGIPNAQTLEHGIQWSPQPGTHLLQSILPAHQFTGLFLNTLCVHTALFLWLFCPLKFLFILQELANVASVTGNSLFLPLGSL